MPWSHFSLLPGSYLSGDARCATAKNTEFAFLTTGDYDGDGIDEIVVGIDHRSKTTSNDLWAMKFDGEAFQHMAPRLGHPLGADIDCSTEDIAAAWAVSGDFDGDGKDEIAVRPQLPGTEGNDLWVQRFVPAQSGAAAHFEPFGAIPGHWFGASIDCSALPLEADLMATGDFDGDGSDEIIVGNRRRGSGGNDFWVQKWNPNSGMFQPMSMIPGHPLEASIDCSGLNYRARFLVVGDFDGDGADEIAFGIDARGTLGNDLWVQKWTVNGFVPWAQIPGHGMDASIDCTDVDRAADFAVVGDFDGDGRDEIAIAIKASPLDYREENNFWVQKWDPNTGLFGPMNAIPGNPLGASIDCGGGEPAGFAVAGDFDGDGADELVIFLSKISAAWAQKLGGLSLTGLWGFGFFDLQPPYWVPSPSFECTPTAEWSIQGSAGRFSVDERYAVAALPSPSSGSDLDFWVMTSCPEVRKHTLLGTMTIASTSLPFAGPLAPVGLNLGFDLSSCTQRSGSITSWSLAPLTLTCRLPLVGNVSNTITTSLVDSWSFSFRRSSGSMSFWLKLSVIHSAPVPPSEIDLFFDTAAALAPPFIGVPMDSAGRVALVGTGANPTLGNVSLLLGGRIAPTP